MTNKKFRKKGEKLRTKYTDELSKQIVLFVEDCKGKSTQEIKDLYKWYEGNWHKFANSMNNRHKSTEDIMVIGFTDAFESSMMNAYKELPNMKGLSVEEMAHYKRVFTIFKHRNIFERVFHSLFSSN